MDGPGAGALSGAEKEKVRGWAGAGRGAGRGGASPSPVRCVLQLREKLALLRREYSETVSRLRRARRAERARSHGWGGPEGGGRRQPSPSGSRDNLSPSADKHGTSQLQTKPCLDLDTEKKTSVRCEHVPEFFSKEGGQQDSSGAGSTQDSQEGLCCGSVRPAPEGKKTQTSRSLMKLRRRTKAPVLEERESVCDVHLTKADGMVTTARAEELRSPVFRRSSLLDTEENAQTAPRAALVWREDNRLTPPDAAFGVVQEVLEDSVLPGVPELSPCALRDSSCVWQPKSPGAAAMSDNPEPAQLCLENSDSVLLDTSGNGGKESPRITQQVDGESVCEDQGELCRLLDFMSEKEVLPADGINTETNEGKSCEGNQSDTTSFPADLALGSVEELMENQQLETQSRLSPPEKVTAPESALNSCTMVEGLLFPVEYYVRTTRRMSNCQRKVDLEAVILSQLGRSKKGQRSKCKQKDANSDRSSQEIAENGVESGVMPFPFLGAENDASSSQQSPPASSGSSTSLGSVSQSSITGTRRDLRRRQRRRKGRGSGCSPGQRGSQELGLSSGLMMPGESSCPLSNVCQGENESCDLGRAPSDESRLSAAAALGSGKTNMPSAVQPASAGPAPGGSQVLGKRLKTLLEQAQNPLQSSHSLTPGNETLPGHVGDLEANLHAEIQPVHRAHRDEQLPVINVPLRRSLRSSARHRDSPASPGAAASPDESKRGRSHPAASEGPASPGLPATDLNTCSSRLPFRSLQWLAPTLGVRDFHLPDEEFGLLKLEKLASSPVNDLEVFVPSVFGDDAASEDEPDAQMDPEGKRLTSNLLLPLKTGWPKLPHGESPPSKRELPTHELLFTPMGSVLAAAPLQPESQISEPIFPVVGATPAVPPSGHSELCPSLQPSLPSSQEASVPALQDRECKASALPQHWDSCGAGSAREEEKQHPTLPLEAEGGPNNQPSEAVALEKHQQSESKEQRFCRASPEQKTAGAGQLTPALLDGLREESLQLVSKLKDSSSSCAVDVSTMWWGAAGSKELCVVTACESSVSLWKPLASDHWEKLHTWQLGEIPVIQIVPLPDTCNLVCVALGDLEIGEVRLLLYSTEDDSFKQSLVKAGNIKAVLGLQERRLVSSCRTGQEQQVEMVSLAETGRSKDGQTLMPPEETVLAFAEVEGMREALVGTTAVNSIVVWNLKTGQLLKKMHVGCSYLASICHRAYSDSGLLFVVLSHPHAKESESCGSPAFRLVAFNPRTARSAGVLCSSLPPGQAGRYLEGDVQDTSAVAVLTSGAIAVWDLLLGHCTALLPPGPQGSWALARWATTSACLLAGQRDGTVCLYRYRQPQPGAA